ncbi:hypothetical protein RND81_04G021500 [Saponaria officinalis]|uniref:Uncharacterized protein n=1 Tax=Saponaria officinalis TaxID=3572 RepID=A0AAW1LFP5_SAPOF
MLGFGSMHFYKKDSGFFGGHGIVGAQVLIHQEKTSLLFSLLFFFFGIYSGFDSRT